MRERVVARLFWLTDAQWAVIGSFMPANQPGRAAAKAGADAGRWPVAWWPTAKTHLLADPAVVHLAPGNVSEVGIAPDMPAQRQAA
jgi:hypothetical protein